MRPKSVLLALACCGLLASPAAAQTQKLSKPAPSWLTDQLRAQIHAAGAEGVQVAAEYLNVECPGFQTRGVSANGCIVAPYGCTANFIFSDGTDWRTQPYIGTASHCSDNNGEVVIMQVDTTTLAEVGTVVKQTAASSPATTSPSSRSIRRSPPSGASTPPRRRAARRASTTDAPPRPSSTTGTATALRSPKA